MYGKLVSIECVKNLERIENTVFVNVKNEVLYILLQKSFSMFGGIPLNTSKHTKTFFSKMLNHFFPTFTKNVFSII